MRWRLIPFGLATAFVIGSAQECEAQGTNAQLPRNAGDVVLEFAKIKPANVEPIEFELGTLFVPENRAEPKSRLIGVGFARFKARAKSDALPIFLLPGGPGFSYLKSLKLGSVSPGLVRQILRYREIGDVVLVDQRGFSERGDVLLYRYRTADEPLDQPASLERSSRAFAERSRAAVAEFEKRGVDLRGYTVKECADDVDDLRGALGYERITLVGVSFGSQWSFAVMRRHADHVARALLAGVEPLENGYDMPSDILAAIRRIWFEAEQDSRFRPLLPPGGLMQAANDVLERLRQEPVRVPLPGVTDPATGATATITLGHEDFQRDPSLRSLESPAFVLSVYHGHYGRWAQSVYATRRGRPDEFPVIAALIDTGLGVTSKRKYLLENDPAVAQLGRWNFHSFLATAEIWPSPDVGDDFRTATDCPIPVVFLHGDWDLQTPVENTLQIAPYFRNGHVLLVERAGHGVMGQIEQFPAITSALARFLTTGETADLPTRIAIPAPKLAAPNFAVSKEAQPKQ